MADNSVSPSDMMGASGRHFASYVYETEDQKRPLFGRQTDGWEPLLTHNSIGEGDSVAPAALCLAILERGGDIRLGPSRFTPCLEISSSLTAGLLLAVAYTLGVVFDRVWDFLLDVTSLQIWLRQRPGPPDDDAALEANRKRRRVYGADAKSAVDFVNYHRSRMRVARASLFNFILITLSGLGLLTVRYGGAGTVEFALAAASGGLLCLASALALRNLGRTHETVLDIVSAEDEGTLASSAPGLGEIQNAGAAKEPGTDPGSASQSQ